jgi:undecaprenyl-diphosphatase
MELTILHFFESIHTPILNKIMFYITMLGEKGIFWIVIALLMLFVLPKRYRKVGLTMALALVFSIIVCNLFLKNMIQRDRPFWIDPTFENLFGYFETIDDWSFPSGHTAASFAAAVAIRMWRKVEGNIAIIIAVLIAISRMYLCVHFPTDVLVSTGLGIIFGIAAYHIVKWAINKFPKLRKIFKGGQSYLVLFGVDKKSKARRD